MGKSALFKNHHYTQHIISACIGLSSIIHTNFTFSRIFYWLVLYKTVTFLCLCVCVCSATIITCGKLRHSVTMLLQPQAQWKLLEVYRLNRPRYVKLD